MSYNILGITPGHNSSVCLVADGELVFYLEEDRLSKIKYESNPLKTMFYILERYKVDELVISGVDEIFIPIIPPPPVTLDVYTSLVKKFNSKVKTTMMHTKHHLTHASHTFYNSGFKEAAIVVVDNTGSTHNFKNNIVCEENETIYKASYPNNFSPLFKTYFARSSDRVYQKDLLINDSLNITKCYELLTQYFGWSSMEAGKTMGLSSYGNSNNNLSKFFKNGRGDRDIFLYQAGFSGHIDYISSPELKLENNPKEWHRDSSKITNLEKDMAYNMQQESQKLVGDLVEKAVDLTGQTNVCITGGYGLNCVANYYMLKRFPNINFYHEPLAHDAGNSIGAALYRWYEHSKDTIIRPRKTLYNGPQYTKDELVNGIKNYI
jgi:carbamoyltransferase